ncbi:MAG: glycerophosphodiester phosphodiesterase family protein [Vicinamibacterales bacterium]
MSAWAAVFLRGSVVWRAPTARAAMCLGVVVTLAAGAILAANGQSAGYRGKTLIAHRGASAYAPEHTFAAYSLAIAQGADYVEVDLQVTKDGQLVCVHDLTLERTTNVKALFPDRARTLQREGRPLFGWHVSDFTLADIKRLDAGAWFDATFQGERVPTFQEAIDLIKGKSGIFPETKAPEVYGSLGFDMEALVMAVLTKNGLGTPGADPATPVFLQSFSAASLRKMRRDLQVKLPLLFLIDGSDGPGWLTREQLKEIRTFADGIGPAKALIAQRPEMVQWAHDEGLSVTPFTFRSAGQPGGRNVRDEMEQFLYEFGVDAVFTDNPDRFPRR